MRPAGPMVDSSRVTAHTSSDPLTNLIRGVILLILMCWGGSAALPGEADETRLDQLEKRIDALELRLRDELRER